jgi:tRNA(fMet)-specific endonuclease VapC
MTWSASAGRGRFAKSNRPRVVAAELRYGAAKKGSPRLTAQLDAILGALDVLPLDEPVEAVYGSIPAHLERAGQPIGANDLLVAAHAVALGLALVTDNDRELMRVQGLTCENRLRE